ncbi:MAG: hypothetical protein AMJ77_06880 [Dehalococcoidia bacterium SM23_28_2]|nr:MAG: hypothetical protein AMJ77_06880 [Dehalococcoidia bacterium SM23_28_2]
MLLVVLAAAAIGGFFAYQFWFSDSGSNEETFNTYRVTTTTMRSTVTTSGEARAMEEILLSFGIAGRVSSVGVELGDEVKGELRGGGARR